MQDGFILVRVFNMTLIRYPSLMVAQQLNCQVETPPKLRIFVCFWAKYYIQHNQFSYHIFHNSFLTLNLFKIKNIFEKLFCSQYWSLLRNIQILFWRCKYDLPKHHIDQSEGVEKFIGLRSNQLFCLVEEILNRKLHKNAFTEFIVSDEFFRHPLHFVRSKFINDRKK